MARWASSLYTGRFTHWAKTDTEAFKELCRKESNGIILTAGNPHGLAPQLMKPKKKGIRVVCVSTDAPESRRSSIVCVEPWLNGRSCGRVDGQIRAAGVQSRRRCWNVERGGSSAENRGLLGCVSPQLSRAERSSALIEGHEDEDESFQKTFDLLGRVPNVCRTIREHRQLPSRMPGSGRAGACREGPS